MKPDNFRVVTAWEDPGFEEAPDETAEEIRHHTGHIPNLDENESEFGRYVERQMNQCPCVDPDVDLVAVLGYN